ncbi:MAG: amidohydrolase family protein [Thermomicrobiales bacterium]
MPDFPIIDAHVHLWDPARFAIPWLEGAPALNKPFSLAEYGEATKEIRVEGVVYLEIDIAPAYALIEARHVVDLASQDARIMGIIAHAPVEDGDRVRVYLEALVALSSKIKGIRRLTQGLPDPEFCLRPGFVRGVQLLPKYGLSCDLCCTYRELGPTVELVRRCPETSFILDHIGKPNIRGGELNPWAEQMAALASLPNTVCKISGVLTEANLEAWTIEDVKPYVMHALEVFGEDRVVFGSDWPVVLGAASHQRWVSTLDDLTADFSEDAKRKLWAENVRRFYRLDA